MAGQRGLKDKNKTSKPEKDNTAKNKRIKIRFKSAATAKVKEKARPKSDKLLTKTQKALRPAHVVLEPQSQPRNKASKALTKAREELAAARLAAEQEREVQIRRASFVVRLTLDKHGQFGRTEIEHVSSSRKQNFLSLDGEHLVTFIKACIGPTISPEPAIPPAPPPENVETPTPTTLRPKSSLVVSDIQLFSSAPNPMALTIMPEEPFIVRVRFQLQGPEAPSLTAQEFSFEMKVYANEVTSGKSKPLTTYSAELIQDMLEYEVRAEMPGLQPGFYRLFTLVTLGTPIKVAGYHDGPIIQVI